MRGAGGDQRLQFRRVGAEGTIPARQTRLESFQGTIQHNDASRLFGDCAAFGVEERPTAKRHDLSLPCGNSLELALLDRPEARLAVRGENLGDGPSLRLHDLRIEVDKRPPRRRGDLRRQCRFSARRRAIKEKIV